MICELLLTAKNFKKSAKALPDNLLENQIRFIYMIREYLFGNDTKYKSKEFLSFLQKYQTQIKYIYRYQCELLKEHRYRFNDNITVDIRLFKTMARRLGQKRFPMYRLYGIGKWTAELIPEPIALFNSKGDHYTKRKPPKGVTLPWTQR